MKHYPLVYDNRDTAERRCEALNNARFASEMRRGKYVAEDRRDSQGDYYEVVWQQHDSAA